MTNSIPQAVIDYVDQIPPEANISIEKITPNIFMLFHALSGTLYEYVDAEAKVIHPVIDPEHEHGREANMRGWV